MIHQLRSVVGSLLESLADDAIRSLRGVVVGTAEQLARVGAKWLLKMAAAHLIGAALAITGLVFALSAVVAGVVALGVHPAIANAVAALIAGGGGWFMIRRAGKQSFAETLKHDEEAEESAPSGGGGGLTIQIVRAAAPAKKKKKAKKPAPSRRKIFDVHRADPEGWEVTSAIRPRKKRLYRTKEKALAAARREASKHEPSRVIVHREDGEIEDTLMFSRSTGT